MIKQANLFTMGATPGGELFVTLIPPAGFIGRIMQPTCLYDGGLHAILYRNPAEAIVLDYVPEAYREKLAQAENVWIGEFDPTKRDVAKPYAAKITRVAKMPDMDLLTEDELRSVLRAAA